VEVREAVQLIADGYLDGRNEDDLARRVGYSARQLRRLFRVHIGATPDFVARSRRAHLARRLLDETDLSMAQVARAAGFGSTRQMRRVVETIFRFAPEELRARRARTDRLATDAIDGGLRLRLPYVPPLDFRAALERLAERCVPGVESVSDERYRRTILDHERVGVIEVTDHGDGRHLELIAHLPTWRLISEEVAACRRLFALDAPRDRALGVWDVFEAEVLRLLGGRSAERTHRQAAARLAERFGVPLPVPLSGLTHAFPSPLRLALADPADVAGCQVSRKAAHAVVAFAQEVSAGTAGRATRAVAR
jgi:AraC family transcriptional regulator of adaptative response / DNA-3-methyladenine glycosylase II